MHELPGQARGHPLCTGKTFHTPLAATNKLTNTHFVQCPSNALHKFCFSCCRDSIIKQGSKEVISLVPWFHRIDTSVRFVPLPSKVEASPNHSPKGLIYKSPFRNTMQPLVVSASGPLMKARFTAQYKNNLRVVDFSDCAELHKVKTM